MKVPKVWEEPPRPMIIKGWAVLMRDPRMESGYRILGPYEYKGRAEEVCDIVSSAVVVAPVEFVVPPEKLTVLP